MRSHALTYVCTTLHTINTAFKICTALLLLLTIAWIFITITGAPSKANATVFLNYFLNFLPSISQLVLGYDLV